MQYSLQFNFVGLQEANVQLKEMLALLSQISSGKLQAAGGAPASSVGGSGGGVQIISPQQLQNLERASRGVSSIKKEVQSLATASAQGFGKNTFQFLKNLSPGALERTLQSNPGLRAAWNQWNAQPAAVMQDPKARNEARRQMRDTASFMKDMTFGMMPLLNPGSPWGTLFATRQIFSAMMTEKGQGMLGKFGLSGAKGAGIAAGISVAGLTAIGFALEGFRKALEGARAAIGKAFGVYTGAAQQGLSTSFYTNRQALGGVFGVSGNANQVFMFGKAVQEVEKRIGAATDTISKNAKPLAETEMNFRVLKLDVDALTSKIAVGLVPAINAWINAIDFLAKLTPPAWMKVAGRIGVGLATFGASEIMGLTNRMMENKFGTSGFGKGGLPQLMSPMQQMPVSQWEKMGLVIAGGLQNKAIEYQRRTAVATETIAKKMAGGVPRGMQNFGMSLDVSNP